MFSDKHILIGIGGGIAVYRVAELARLLMKQGATVRCVMTQSACEFVTPLTFESLTGEKVHTDLFDLTAEREMGHIQLARWADVLLVAPATADLIAKFAHGIADNLLTTLFQVCEVPVLLAPAMNASMWESDATQRNIADLKKRGLQLIGPETGELACGERGPGRMSEPETILHTLHPLVCEQTLTGQQWVINAGPTWEAWDNVRVLTSRATGMLGVHLAEAAIAQGANVTLIAGPGTPVSSPLVQRINVESAANMQQVCEQQASGADVFIATAAVSDFRFAHSLQGKIKRGDAKKIEVDLDVNPDIVAYIAAMPDRPGKVIAFAAECEDHIDHARSKLQRKGADAIFANDIANMGTQHAGGWWITPEAAQSFKRTSKRHLAEQIIAQVQCMEASA
ncbi:MAG: bifunctional phosphopantothenoylcysteine decarboxylase/phosphopantothenate--cysteine ligase CoaBC [Mariprofundaceae bacterium]